MRILLSSDTHDSIPYLDYLVETYQKTGCQLFVLAGDVLCKYNEEGRLDQILRFRKWTKKIKDLGIPLVLCCGNHDSNVINPFQEYNPPKTPYPNEEEEISRLIENTEWMRDLSHPTLQTPNESRWYGKPAILVTTLKYGRKTCGTTQRRNAETMNRAASQRGGKTWVVVGHQPPQANGFCPESLCSFSIQNLLETHQPDLYLCGHYHIGPSKANTPLSLLGRTLLINTGQTRDEKIPHHAIISLNKKTILWKTPTQKIEFPWLTELQAPL